MKLSDIMSHAGLSFYSEVALVVFMLVFVAVAIYTWLPSRRRELEDTARLPLDDDNALPHHPRSQEN